MAVPLDDGVQHHLAAPQVGLRGAVHQGHRTGHQGVAVKLRQRRGHGLAHLALQQGGRAAAHHTAHQHAVGLQQIGEVATDALGPEQLVRPRIQQVHHQAQALAHQPG